jgi:membrane protein
MSGYRMVMKVFDLSDRVHLGLIAAGVAFYGMFSIFPALAAVIALFGLVADPAIVISQLELIREFVPEGAYLILQSQIQRLLSAQTGTLGWATALSLSLALWSARAAVGALVRGINAVYGQPLRGGLWHIAVAFGLTIALIGVAITALLTVVIAPVFLAFLPVSWGTGVVLEVVRWGTAFFVLVVGLGLLYRYGPNRPRRELGLVSAGSLMVIVLWFAASLGFNFYLSNFGSYNEVYGSIGAVAAMLMWLYISAYLILLGAALNAILEKRRRSRAHPTGGSDQAEADAPS